MLKYILLGFLNYAPMTGYDLKRLIDQSTAHFWHAYHSQIYTTLARLEDTGLLTSEVDDTSDDKLSRRTYTITPAGQAALRAWQHKPLTTATPAKNELLVRLFFASVRDTADILDELRIQRRLHQQQLEHYQAIRLCEQGIDEPGATCVNRDRERVFWQITLDHGLAYETMYLDWLDETIARLEAR